MTLVVLHLTLSTTLLLLSHVLFYRNVIHRFEAQGDLYRNWYLRKNLALCALAPCRYSSRKMATV